MVEYSVVVPVYNESGNISKLNKEIQEVMSKLSKSFEVIFINDASKDGSLEELKSLKNVVIINMNRNYGQTTAFDAGFKYASGDIIISMDGDGQNDPHDIPRLLEKMKKENLDVVCGWRKNRADKKGVHLLSRTGKFLRKFLIKDTIHDTGCALRVYKKEAVKSLDLQGEMHRYILALLRWKGFKIGEIVVNDRVREHGVSKYGYSKAIRGFLDLIYIWFIDKYSQRPLHLFGYMSLISGFLGFLCLLESVLARIIWSMSLNRNGFFFLGFFFIIISLILFCFGVMFDLLIKIHLNNSPVEKRYYIREIIKK